MTTKEGTAIAGESWRQTWQIGKESTEGTAVPATRKLYLTGNGERARAPHLVMVSTGTRDNVRDARLRSVAAGAKFSAPLSADEIIELLLGCLNGGVTGVQELTTGHYTWTFAPGNTLDPQTYEWFDGYNGWQLNGCHVDELKFSGTIGADTKVDATVFARDMVTHTITPSLTDRAVTYIEGWEAKLFIDAFGATAGTTNIAGELIAWEVDIKNKLGRKYFGDNTTATGAVTIGDLEVTASITLEATTSAITEEGNWDAATKRLVQLYVGNNGANIGTSSTKPGIKFNLPGVWTTVDFSGADAGTKVLKFGYSYVYDVTNGYGVQVVVDSSRSAAY